MIFVLLLLHNRTNKGADTLSAIFISVLLYYCAIPLLIYIFSKDVVSSTFVDKVIKASLPQFLNGCFCVFLFVISVSIAHKYSNRTIKQKSYTCTLTRGYKNLLKKFIRFCSVVGISCFALYILSFGGVMEMLQQSELVRSFSGDSDIPYLSKILVFPACFVVLVPCFVTMFIDESNKNLFLLKLFFVFSFLLALLFHINNAGKTGIIVFFIAIAVPILYKYSNHAWLIVLLAGITGVSLVGYLDNFFLFFTTGTFYEVEGESFLDNISQFAYPSSNIMSLDGIAGISGIRMGQDILTGILSQIPGVKLPLSFEFTSQYYGGTLWREGGGTPTDSVTFGYMQLSYLGVCFWGLVIGSLSGWVDRLFNRLGDSFGKNYFKSTLILAFFVLTTNSDIFIIIRNQFSLWVPLLFLLLLKNKNKVRT